MVFVQKMAIFPTSFCQAIQARKTSLFSIFQIKKRLSRLEKKKFKKSKNDHFSKKVNPWFWSQNDHFFNFFFFMQYRPGQCVLRYFRTKNAFLGYKKQKLKKAKNCIFLTSFFQAIQARKMCFTIFSNKRTPFQALKTRSLKSRRIAIFLKRLTHGFCPKMAIFLTFFWGGGGKIAHENVFQDILERKNTFLAYNNKKIKKSKNCNFSKGVNPWFWSKRGHFSTSFF